MLGALCVDGTVGGIAPDKGGVDLNMSRIEQTVPRR
jgi:hypothetical protein